MGALEIILILVGAVMIFGSFFITEKFSNKDVEELKELTEREMKRVIADKIADAKVDMEDALEIAVDNAVETIDVRTDKETNTKISQISEYSDTVLESMDKSHKEVMFMYSMLNDKHRNVVDMESRLEKIKAEVKAIDESVAKKFSQLSDKEKELAEKQAQLEQKEKALEIQKEAQLSLEAQLQAKYEQAQKEELEKAKAEKEAENAEADEADSKISDKDVEVAESDKKDPVVEFINGINEKSRTGADELPASALFAGEIPGPEDDVKENKNKQILEMHDIGMSEIDIAKKLGIGLGEVKFVLGLYQEK